METWSKKTKWNGDDDRVFANPLTGKSFDASKLTKRFREYIIAGEIGEFVLEKNKKGELVREPALHFHSLRHTFGVASAKNPKNSLVDIQFWMGHKDIKTTMIYAQFQPRRHCR